MSWNRKNWNGKKVDNEVVGWYVDKAIQTIALPKIKQGENILEVEVPIGKLPMIYYPPYIAKLGTVDAGKHTIDLAFYGTRQNGFGTLHLADEKRPYLNTSSWRTTGDEWCYEYMLRRMGVLATPEIIEKK